MYCLEYLEANLDWLAERLAPLEEEGRYFIFDLPGQVRRRGGCSRVGVVCVVVL